MFYITLYNYIIHIILYIFSISAPSLGPGFSFGQQKQFWADFDSETRFPTRTGGETDTKIRFSPKIEPPGPKLGAHKGYRVMLYILYIT